MRESATAPSCPRCKRHHLPAVHCWAGRYVYQVRARVLATYGDTCCHCGLRGATSVEHVRPRAFGGTDELANLRPAHLACNQARGTNPMPGWSASPTLTTERAPGW